MTCIATSLTTKLLCEALSDPAVSASGKEPTRGPVYLTANLVPYKMVASIPQEGTMCLVMRCAVTFIK